MNHQEMFGNALWIGCDEQVYTPYIRAAFAARKGAKGTITICGLGMFELYINGKRISDDLFVPVTSDYVKRSITVHGLPFDEEMHHRCYVLRYDITDALQEGENQLAVALGPGFFATPLDSFDGEVRFGQVRLCYRIQLENADGSTEEAVSGGDTKWDMGNVTESYFFNGEKQDLRRHGEDWTCAPFDGWKNVKILENMDTEYYLQDCPGDKVIRLLEPKLIAEYDDVKIYDAGENISGWVVLEDEGAEGDMIRVELGEALDPENPQRLAYTQDQFLEVISDGKGRTVHPRFMWHGFRYFSVKGRAKVRHAELIHSDIPKAGRFESSDPVLNWTHDAFVHTLLCNSHGGIPSDCPHIEKRGYTGDGQLTMEAALYALNHQAFVRKWIRDISDCQDRHSGHVQYTAPYTRCGGGPGGWGSAIVSVPYQYYLQYGDAALLRRMYPQMKEYIRYLEGHSQKDLVVSDREGEWCLGDWCCPGGVKLPAPFVNNYFLIKSVNIMEKIADILGEKRDAACAELKEKAIAAVYREYFDPDTGNFSGNIQGSNAFMLDLGLGDERTLANLIAYYEEKGVYDTGIFGTDIVTRVLFEKGAAATAYKLLHDEKQQAFAGWIKEGATTMWEYWACDWQRSLSHPMFGAVVASLYKYVLGIRQEAGSAGWEKAVIEPMLVREVPCLSGHTETRKGKICVTYDYADGILNISVDIPCGVQAVLRYGGKEIQLSEGKNQIKL
ncbi:MAG: hypothetical protein E7326_08200 [Clostridiales bacterium]|nr:hypothetical protein [Clostridiales bacterium]